MSVSSYALVDGIPGPAKGSGVEGQIELYEFSYDISLPTDLRDGTITGRRQHGYFLITHELGKHSPLFAKHICENAEISSVTVSHYRPDAKSGDLVKYFSHVMKSVKVVTIVHSKPNTCSPTSKPFRDMETVRFMFEEITIKDEEGCEYVDVWEIGS